MKNKKVLAALLVAAMTLGLTACGGNDSGSVNGTESGSKADGNYDQVTYAYCTFNNIPTEEDLDVVEDAINQITREKIGAEITLMPIAIADYSSKVSLALQGGEKIDIFESLGDFNNYVSTDMTYDLTDLLYQYGQETVDTVSEEWLAACAKDGSIYGVPTMKPVALTPMVVYRQDVADELGIDMSQVSSMEDMTDIFKQVKAAYPDMTPLAPVQTGEIGVSTNYGEVDFLTDDRYSPIGVLEGDDLTGDALEPVKALTGHILRQDRHGLAGQQLGVEGAATAVVAGGGPYGVMIGGVKLSGHQTGSQTAEGSAHLVAAGGEPLAGHGNDTAGNAGELGGDLHIVGDRLEQAAALLGLVVPGNTEQVHGIHVPQAGGGKLGLDLLRDQIGVLHLSNGGDDNVVLLGLLDVMLQANLVDGQIDHVFSSCFICLRLCLRRCRNIGYIWKYRSILPLCRRTWSPERPPTGSETGWPEPCPPCSSGPQAFPPWPPTGR